MESQASERNRIHSAIPWRNGSSSRGGDRGDVARPFEEQLTGLPEQDGCRGIVRGREQLVDQRHLLVDLVGTQAADAGRAVEVLITKIDVNGFQIAIRWCAGRGAEDRLAVLILFPAQGGGHIR